MILVLYYWHGVCQWAASNFHWKVFTASSTKQCHGLNSSHPFSRTMAHLEIVFLLSWLVGESSCWIWWRKSSQIELFQGFRGPGMMERAQVCYSLREATQSGKDYITFWAQLIFHSIVSFKKNFFRKVCRHEVKEASLLALGYSYKC